MKSMINNDSTLIRPALATDLNILVGLLGQLFEIEREFKVDAEAHRRGLQSLLDNPDNAWIWVALYENKVIGMCTAQKLVSTAIGAQVLQIEDVVVDKHYRGTGIGSALLSHIENFAEENGFGRLQLVADKNNPPALDFYRKQSWDKTTMIWHWKHMTVNSSSESDRTI